MPLFCLKSSDTETMSWNWKGELTEYSRGRIFDMDSDRDRFIDSMRCEGEGFWRCAGEDDDEAWLSGLDTIHLNTRKR